jgi:Tol biopolymer transport system component
VLFQAPGKGTGLDIWAFNPVTREVTGVATSGFNESDARWSPDGALLAYVSDESGRPDIYVTAAAETAAAAGKLPEGGRVRVSFGGGTRPRWSRDGQAVFFLRDDQIMRAAMTAQGFDTPVAVIAAAGVRDFAVAHRSDRILAVSPLQRSAPAQAAAVVDWLSTLSPPGEARPATTEP